MDCFSDILVGKHTFKFGCWMSLRLTFRLLENKDFNQRTHVNASLLNTGKIILREQGDLEFTGLEGWVVFQLPYKSPGNSSVSDKEMLITKTLYSFALVFFRAPF